MLKKYRILLIVFLILITVDYIGCKQTNEANTFLIPSLPSPIAKEDVLITSAGQSTDAYIIRDMACKLMLHNYFMPDAKEIDIDGINTIVFVVGYSEVGIKGHGLSIDDERLRISNLLKKSEDNEYTVITVYIGGKQRRCKETDELLSIIAPNSDYIIAAKDSDYDGYITKLAKSGRAPLSLVNGVNDITISFASAFR